MATLTDTIGRVLSGRYRVEAALGTGASAHVYLATDVSLKRRVAIKMLHPVLAADRSFLKRFRAEAQAAASLTHPNLVAVYDWGEDVDGPYLVLEYLGGGSFRDLLDSGTPLDMANVATVGAQAAHGLAYAHARGFVHRDVKPANLLFDDDRRRLCVADFGLARALAEAAWTEPVGATLGTARYAAPEQAQGKRVDGRADVYGLALVLYEALTGSVPFSSDTTIGTLMARVGATLPPHDALGPLDSILKAAAAPEPEERLSAAELARRLSQIARELPRPAALPGSTSPKAWRPYDDVSDLGTNGSGTANTPLDHTNGPLPAAATSTATKNGNGAANGTDGTSAHNSVIDPREISGGTDAMALAEAIGVAEAGSQVRSGEKTSVLPKAAPTSPNGSVRTDDLTEIGAAGVGAPASAPSYGEPGAPGQPWVPDRNDRGATDETEHGFAHGYGPSAREVFEKRRHRRWPWLLALVIIILAGVGAGALIAQNRYHVFVKPSFAVPSLKGLTQAQATSAVSKDKFHVKVTGQVNSLTAKAGTIVSQSPAGGKLKQGGNISVVTSSGLPSVTVPNLATVTGGCQSVTSVLGSVHLVPSCTQTTSLSVKAGSVISYTPTTSALYGSTVKVVVSTGLPQVQVPNLTGLSKAQATTLLQGDHFVVAYGTSQYSSTVADGEVLAGWTGEGQSLTYGSTVTISISLGHAPVQVPNVANGQYDVAQAESTLRQDGLTIQGVFGPGGASTVVDTDPAGGTTVPYGTPVSIYTGYGA